MTNFVNSHRFFRQHASIANGGLEELAPPPWTPAIPTELRYSYDVLEAALPDVQTEGLRFYFTKDAYHLAAYGRDVVGVLLQEERCKVPVYGRHVRAVLRNLHSRPFLGFRPHLGFTRLEAVLTFEYVRDTVTSARARYALEHPPAYPQEPVRREPRTIHLPLGYHSQVELPQVPMAERAFDTFFQGQVTEEIPAGSYKRWTSTSKIEARKQIWAELRKLKKDPRWMLDLGDVAAGFADAFRSFEGLRAGCLVVANPLPRDEFLYPQAPLLIVDHWRELSGILERYARDFDTLEEWRARSLSWWRNHLRPEVVGRMVAQQLNEAGATLL